MTADACTSAGRPTLRDAVRCADRHHASNARHAAMVTNRAVTVNCLGPSWVQKGQKVETPHLDVRYRAQRESRFMQGPLPSYDRIRV